MDFRTLKQTFRAFPVLKVCYDEEQYAAFVFHTSRNYSFFKRIEEKLIMRVFQYVQYVNNLLLNFIVQQWEDETKKEFDDSFLHRHDVIKFAVSEGLLEYTHPVLNLGLVTEAISIFPEFMEYDDDIDSFPYDLYSEESFNFSLRLQALQIKPRGYHVLYDHLDVDAFIDDPCYFEAIRFCDVTLEKVWLNVTQFKPLKQNPANVDEQLSELLTIDKEIVTDEHSKLRTSVLDMLYDTQNYQQFIRLTKDGFQLRGLSRFLLINLVSLFKRLGCFKGRKFTWQDQTWNGSVVINVVFDPGLHIDLALWFSKISAFQEMTFFGFHEDVWHLPLHMKRKMLSDYRTNRLFKLGGVDICAKFRNLVLK